MTKSLQEAVRLARHLPEDAQDRMAQILRALAHSIDAQELNASCDQRLRAPAFAERVFFEPLAGDGMDFFSGA